MKVPLNVVGASSYTPKFFAHWLLRQILLCVQPDKVRDFPDELKSKVSEATAFILMIIDAVEQGNCREVCQDSEPVTKTPPIRKMGKEFAEHSSYAELLRGYRDELEECKKLEKARNEDIRKWKDEVDRYMKTRNVRADSQTDPDLSFLVDNVDSEQGGKFGAFVRCWALDKLYRRALDTDNNDIKFLGLKTRRGQILEQLYPRIKMPRYPVWTGKVYPAYWRKTKEVYKTHSQDEALKLGISAIRLRT